jgi:tetratricopeptide (TPR) repeat protein
LNGARRHTLHPRSYFQPRYDRYRYCRPYRHFHVRRHFPRYRYWDRYRPYYGYYYGFGYYPYSTYYGVSHYYPTYGYSSYDYYYPSTYLSYTPAYVSDWRTDDFDDQDVYYTNNIYIGDETEEVTTGGQGSIAVVSTPQVQQTAPVVGSAIQPSVQAEAAEAPPAAEQEPTLVDIGNAAFNEGDYQEAIRYYVGAVLANDDDGIARLFYGLSQFAIGDYDLAAMGMRRALVVMPDLIDRPIDLRSLYPDLETFESHLAKLVRFVEENPRGTNAMFVLGYVYYASAQPELAVPTLRKLTDLDPNDKEAAQVRNAAISVLSVDEAP